MRATASIAVLLAFARPVTAGDATPAFTVTQQPDRLVITRAGKPVAHFVFRDAKILRPYFAHIHTPDGFQVTRNHPPVAGTDATDHDTMHPGLWLAFGDISGHDFWRNKGTIRHERFTEMPVVKDGRLAFASTSTLITTNGTALATLGTRIQIRELSGGFLLRWSAEFTPTTDDFYFGDQEEMGFGVRVATALSEKKGGVIRSDTGEISAKATWGKTWQWCDYSGTLDGRRIGVVIFPAASNFRASWSHNRDYGLMVANPFGAGAFTKGAKSRVPVAKGETFRLDFAAFIHSTATDAQPDLAAAYQTFLNTTR